MSGRVIAVLFLVAAVASSVAIYLEYVYMLGFPEGHITEIEYAERTLAYAFIAGAVISAIYVAIVGFVSVRVNAVRRIVIVAGFLSILTVCLAIIDCVLRSRLGDSAGG